MSIIDRIKGFLERERIRWHLTFVEFRLRAKNDGRLPDDLRAVRLINLRRLGEYRRRGRFPINVSFPGRRLPHLRDQYGTPCAMAHLIEESGGRELVDALARADNTVLINDVKGGPLVDWLAGSGLTQDEAAQIQPGYDWQNPAPAPVPPAPDVTLAELGSAGIPELVAGMISAVICLALAWLCYRAVHRLLAGFTWDRYIAYGVTGVAILWLGFVSFTGLSRAFAEKPVDLIPRGGTF